MPCQPTPKPVFLFVNKFTYLYLLPDIDNNNNNVLQQYIAVHLNLSKDICVVSKRFVSNDIHQKCKTPLRHKDITEFQLTLKKN